MALLPGFSINVDHFKEINDPYGHALEDQVLVAIAGVLLIRMRRSDQPFRYGGEEFLCLLYDCPDERGAAIAEDIRAGIAALEVTPDLRVTASLGIAV